MKLKNGRPVHRFSESTTLKQCSASHILVVIVGQKYNDFQQRICEGILKFGHGKDNFYFLPYPIWLGNGKPHRTQNAFSPNYLFSRFFCFFWPMSVFTHALNPIFPSVIRNPTSKRLMICSLGFSHDYFWENGLSLKWRRWVYFCISTVHFLVLVNGEATVFFPSMTPISFIIYPGDANHK